MNAWHRAGRSIGRRVAALATLILLIGGIPSAQASPGDLDTGFSSDGKVLTDIGTADSGRAVAIQADGKVVVAGYARMGSDDDFAVARYDSDGALDGAFSSDGLITVDFDNKNESGYAVAVQSDGKIVVAGRAATDGMGLTFDFAIVRLTSSGALDTSFSSDGLQTVDVGGGNDYAYAVAVASDGDIVVVGYGSNGSNWDVAAIRLDSSGNLDTDFSSDGKALYAIGSGHDYGYGLDIASDGDLLITGSSHNGSDDDVLVLRLDANGTLDTAFDGDGIWTADIGSGTSDEGRGIVEASDGDVLVGGSTDDGARHDLRPLRRYDHDGGAAHHLHHRAAHHRADHHHALHDPAAFGRTPAVAADDDHRRPALPGRRNPPPALLPGMNRADLWRSGLIRSERG